MPGRRQQLAREVRARLQQHRELEWVAQPAWALGEAIVTPVGDGPRGDDTAAMATVTKAEYLAALIKAVEAGEITKDFLGPEQQEASWQRFEAYRAGDHGPHLCHCSAACIAKLPAPLPQTSVEPAGEVFVHEGGVNRRADLETQITPNDRDEAERLRLLRIAQAAPVQFFTS